MWKPYSVYADRRRYESGCLPVQYGVYLGQALGDIQKPHANSECSDQTVRKLRLIRAIVGHTC